MSIITNLFKKIVSTKELVEQIHAEFNSAGEELLKEANKILANNKFSAERADRLAKIGFNSTKEVIEVNEKREKKRLANITVALIQDYRLRYPNQKFITEEMVEKICTKYNLVCGDISRYKGFVPSHNLKQIEEFTDKYTFNNYVTKSSSSDVSFLDMKYYEIKKRNNYWHFFKKGSDECIFQSDDGICFYSHGTYNGKYIWVSDLIKASMKICAPIKYMDTSGMKLSGYKLEREIPDPIVLQLVDGGYLILTAWGDEASDPLVVNQINN